MTVRSKTGGRMRVPRFGRLKKITTGSEAMVYTNGKYAFKIVYPVKPELPKNEADKLTKRFDKRSAAEQVVRYLTIFSRDHPNIAKARFILPFPLKHEGISKPALLVIQDWIKPNCRQPMVYDTLLSPGRRGYPLNIDPELNAITEEIHPRIITGLGKGYDNEPNIIRRRDRNGNKKDIIIDCALDPLALKGGEIKVPSDDGEFWDLLKYRSQVRPKCRETGRCDCNWPEFLKNAGAGFGKIPSDLKIGHFKQIPEIAPIIPVIQKHIEKRDVRADK